MEKRSFQLKFTGLFMLQISIIPSKAVTPLGICFATCFQTAQRHLGFHVVKWSVPTFLHLALVLTFDLSCYPKLSQQMSMFYSLMKVVTPTCNPNNWIYTSAFGRVVRCPAGFILQNFWAMLMHTVYMKSFWTVALLLVSQVCCRCQWMVRMWTRKPMNCFPQVLRKKPKRRC